MPSTRRKALRSRPSFHLWWMTAPIPSRSCSCSPFLSHSFHVSRQAILPAQSRISSLSFSPSFSGHLISLSADHLIISASPIHFNQFTMLYFTFVVHLSEYFTWIHDTYEMLHHHHHHCAATVSRGWAKASACSFHICLSCAILCQMVSFQ